MALVLDLWRADAVLAPLRELLRLWTLHGPHDIVIPPRGGYRYSAAAELVQRNDFELGLSKAKTLKDTPHGRRCAVDCYPVGFKANRDFASQPGMRAKFILWGEFIDKYGPTLGLQWGGHFKGFGPDGDMPHCEIINWRTLYTFPSGLPVTNPKLPTEKPNE